MAVDVSSYGSLYVNSIIASTVCASNAIASDALYARSALITLDGYKADQTKTIQAQFVADHNSALNDETSRIRLQMNNGLGTQATALTVESNLHTTLHGAVTATSLATLNGGVDVNGVGDVSDTLTCSKSSGTGLVVTSAATVGGTLGVTGLASMNGGLAVTGVGGVSDTLTCSKSSGTGLVVTSNATVGGTLDVTGTSSLADTVTCSKASGTGLAVTSAATVGGTLGVTGLATMNGGVAVNGTGSVSGTLTCSKTSGTGLVVSAGATVTGTATFTAASVHNGGITVNNAGTVTGTLTCSKPSGIGLAVTADATVDGTATFTAASVHNGGITVNNAGTVTGTLTCSNPSGTGLAVTSAATVGGTLGVTGLATFNGGINVNGYGEVTQTLLCSQASGLGMSVTADASIAGNLTIGGNLLVSGATTTVNTQNLVVSDNMVVVNSAPIASRDAGLLIERWPADIVSDSAKHVGLAVGGSTTTLVLPTGLVAGNAEGDDYYNSWYIKITNDTPAGLLNVVRKITDYVHSTRTVTVDPAFPVSPTSSTAFALYNKSHVSMAYNEIADEFVFAATASEANANLSIQDYIDIRAGNIAAEGDIDVAGNLNVTGAVLFDNLDVAQNLTVGTLARIGTVADVPSTAMSIANPSLLVYEDSSAPSTIHLSYKPPSDSVVNGTELSRIFFTAKHSAGVVAPVAMIKVNATGTYAGGQTNNSPASIGFLVQDATSTNTLVTGETDRFSISHDSILSRPVHTFQGGILTNLGSDNIINGTLSINGSSVAGSTCVTVQYNSQFNGTMKLSGNTTSGLLMQSVSSSTANLRADNLGFTAKQFFGSSVLSESSTLAVIRNAFQSSQLGCIANNTTPIAVFVRETTNNTVVANNSIGRIDFVAKDTSSYRTGARIEATATADWGHVSPLYASPTQINFYVEDDATNTETINTSRFRIKWNEITAYQPLVVSAPGTGLSVTGNASVGGTLAVTGLVTMNGGVDINGVGDVSDTLTCSKSSGTGLAVTSAATVGGTLGVTGLATLNGGLAVSGIGSVSDTFTCSKASDTGLAVIANATVGGTLNVTGAATFTAQSVHDGGIDVNGAGDVSGTLTCSKASDTGLAVTANATVGGTLDVTGQATFTAIEVNGLGDIGDTLTCSRVSGTGLAVTANATVGGTMDVTGMATLNGGLTVNGVGAVADTLTCSKASGTGLAVTANATVGGNLTVAGDLLITGTTTTVNTQNLVVSDNMVVVNSAPTASKDGGLLVERWVTDIVADTAKFTGTATGGTTTTLRLPTGLVVGNAEGDDYYNSWYIKITNNTPAGLLNVVRKITDYVHSTRTATVETAFSVAPTTSTTFALYNRPQVSMAYDESADEFVFAATVSEPNTNLNIQEYVNVHVKNITADGDLNVTGAMNVVGGVGFENLTVNNTVYAGSRVVAGALTNTTGLTSELMVMGTGVSSSSSTDSSTLTLHFTPTGGSMVASHVASSIDFTGTHAGVVQTGARIVMTPEFNWNSASSIRNAPTTLGFRLQDNTNLDKLTSDVFTLTSSRCTSAVQHVFSGGISISGSNNVSFGNTLAVNFSGPTVSFWKDVEAKMALNLTQAAGSTCLTIPNNAIAYLGKTSSPTFPVNTYPIKVSDGLTCGKIVAGLASSMTASETVGNSGDCLNSQIVCAAYEQPPMMSFVRETPSAAKEVISGMVLGTMNFVGLDYTSYRTGARITCQATNTWSNTSNNANPSSLLFYAEDGTTTATIGVTPRLKIAFDGIDASQILRCTGSSTIAGEVGLGLKVTASATVGGTLAVTGATTFTAQSVHNGGIDVNGTGDVSGTLTCSKASDTGLAVTANATVGGTLDVTGQATFTAASVHNGGITVTGVGSVSDTLTCSKPSGTGLAVTANATVTGTATFTAQSVHNGGIAVNGVGSVSGTLTCSKASGTGLAVTANATVGGTLDVTGQATFTAASVHNGGITVTGVGSVSDTLTCGKVSGTGLAVTANATVGGNLTVAGDLLITGTTTTVNTQNLVVSDNMVVVNSAPASSKDGGLLVERWLTDILADPAKFSGTATGGSTTTLVLPTGLVAGNAEGDDYYNSWYIKITNDTPAGLLNVVRKITDYVHSTRTVTVDPAYLIAPTSSTTFALYNKSHVSVAYRESADEFVFAATASEANTNLSIQEYVNVRAKNIAAEGDVDVVGDLNVGGIVYFDQYSAATAHITDTLLVDNAITSNGTLAVTGAATFTAQSVHNGGIAVNGVGSVSDTLTCSKASGTGLAVTANATVGGTLAVTGAATFTATSVHNGGITVTGVGSVSDTLTCSKATGTGLAVTGNATVGGTATFTATSVHNGGITVNGVGSVSDTLTCSKASGTGLAVTANATVDGTLGVTGVATFTAASVHNGGITVNGVGAVSDTLTCGKATGTGLAVTANATVGGTINITGAAIFSSTVDAGILRITNTGFTLYRDGINHFGEWSYWDAVSATGIDSLHGGASHFGSIISGSKSGHLALHVPANGTDDSFFICTNANAANGVTDYTPTRRLLQIKNSGDLNFGTAAEVTWIQSTKILTIGGTLDVNGTGDFSGTLTCSKATGTGLAVTTNATVGGTLAVTGAATFTAASVHNGGITVNNVGTVTNTLTCSKATGVGLAVTANATVGGTLDVTGVATFTAESVHNGGITVNNVGTVTDTLTCSKATGTGLAVTANATVGGTATFTGASVHNGGITVNGVGSVSGTLTCSKASGTGLAVTANATVGGNLTVTGNFTVNGTTTTVNTTDLVVTDKNITLASGNSTDIGADGGGFTLLGATNKTMVYNDTNKTWDMSEHVNVAATKEYRVANNKVLDATAAYLGTGAGDGVVYLGKPTTNSSWRIKVGTTGLTFERREGGVWVTKSVITNV